MKDFDYDLVMTARGFNKKKPLDEDEKNVGTGFKYAPDTLHEHSIRDVVRKTIGKR